MHKDSPRQVHEMSVPYAKVIVNPVAGGYSVRRDWPKIRGMMYDLGLSFDYEFTKGKGHAIELAKMAAEIGYSCIVVVGGDGTVNEVANGILRSTRSNSIILGIISAGSACCFSRSLGIPRDFVGACSLLKSKERVVIDVGFVKCENNGQVIERYFVNAADIGLGSSIVDAWEPLPKYFGRYINQRLRTIQGLRCLSKHQNKFIRLSDGNKVETIFSRDFIISNGQYFAGGMKIAPHAQLDDGFLDVVSVQDLGRSELLKLWPKLYRGGHIGNPKITESKTTSITVESEDKLYVEADGIILGETPASFRVIPSALTIMIDKQKMALS
jgi:diacylglycerol kinase (ATP)